VNCFFTYPFLNDESFSRNATLPRVLHPGFYRRFCRAFQVGVSQHDERVGAAQFQH